MCMTSITVLALYAHSYSGTAVVYSDINFINSHLISTHGTMPIASVIESALRVTVADIPSLNEGDEHSHTCHSK